jgi:hypothetical protein
MRSVSAVAAIAATRVSAAGQPRSRSSARSAATQVQPTSEPSAEVRMQKGQTPSFSEINARITAALRFRSAG